MYVFGITLRCWRTFTWMKVHSSAMQLKLNKVYSEHEIISLFITICRNRKILVVWENSGHSGLPQRGLIVFFPSGKSAWRCFWEEVHLLWNMKRKEKHHLMPSANLMFSAQLGNNHSVCTKPNVWSLSLAVQKIVIDFDRLQLWEGFVRILS